ncbi:hypothetical protein [Macrococcoides caseolyticum]|uniref:hypothetical protein n=1 Tax=Macrococcoides caseolyticum TaxID=69966 RepID=UPI001F288E69|nr:hypothetical protein [Macrococcus caseolyticus]MCE4957700.1 hypothetical protein [Macrococcus caseolyticus]
MNNEVKVRFNSDCYEIHYSEIESISLDHVNKHIMLFHKNKSMKFIPMEKVDSVEIGSDVTIFNKYY